MASHLPDLGTTRNDNSSGDSDPPLHGSSSAEPLTVASLMRHHLSHATAQPSSLSEASSSEYAGSSSDNMFHNARDEARAAYHVSLFVDSIAGITPYLAPFDTQQQQQQRDTLRYVTREQLRQSYTESQAALVESLYDCVALEEQLREMDDDLAYLEAKVAQREESLELLQLQLYAAEDDKQALLSEKSEALRKLTEAKGELAVVSSRNVRLQKELTQLRGESPTSMSASPTTTTTTTTAVARSPARAGSEPQQQPPHRLSLGDIHAAALVGENAAPLDGEAKGSPNVAVAVKDSSAATTSTARCLYLELEVEQWKARCQSAQSQINALRDELAAASAAGASAAGSTYVSGEQQQQSQQVVHLERELEREREKTRRLSKVEAKLLGDLAHMARQLRARESLDRDLRYHKKNDSELSREELLVELTACRQAVTELEATVAAFEKSSPELSSMRDYCAVAADRSGTKDLLNTPPRPAARMEQPNSHELRRRRDSIVRVLENARRSRETAGMHPDHLMSSAPVSPSVSATAAVARSPLRLLSARSASAVAPPVSSMPALDSPPPRQASSATVSPARVVETTARTADTSPTPVTATTTANNTNTTNSNEPVMRLAAFSLPDDPASVVPRASRNSIIHNHNHNAHSVTTEDADRRSSKTDALLLQQQRRRSHSASVCISPDSYGSRRRSTTERVNPHNALHTSMSRLKSESKLQTTSGVVQ